MRRIGWQTRFGLALVGLAVFLFGVHYAIFHDFHHIAIYALGDLAFLPIEVLLVTLVIHRLLGEREKRTRLEKLNMVVGAFFSEVGYSLLDRLTALDPDAEEIAVHLRVGGDWTEPKFAAAAASVRRYKHEIKPESDDLERLTVFLGEKRDFLLRLLENPNLLEHERFTDLLFAVFHLTEELAHRGQFSDLPPADLAHLGGDLGRVYVLLTGQWLDYMNHLQSRYPYLFSLAMRTNPFDPEASPIVQR